MIRGFVLGFVVAASPGPVFFLWLRRTLARGWLTGLVSGLGVATADGLYAALAAFGIGAVTTLLVSGGFWLALIGGTVLVLLGIRTVVSRSAVSSARSNIQLSSSWPGASSWSPWIMSRPIAFEYSMTLWMTGWSSENWSMW